MKILLILMVYFSINNYLAIRLFNAGIAYKKRHLFWVVICAPLFYLFIHIKDQITKFKKKKLL